MLAYYGTQISPHMTDTPEGYLICRDVPIARTGEMTYLASELGLEGTGLVRVSRRAEDVFDANALASFEGKDITAGHPAEQMGPVNYAAYSKGHVQNVRRAGEYVLADLLIKDASLISDIRAGVVREVSCGYQCRYVPDGDGYRQEEIRGNHVAIVPKGRAGREVAIKDSAESAGKGKTHMSKFAEAILSALGMAAKEAKDDNEVQDLVSTAAAALDAEPTGDCHCAAAQPNDQSGGTSAAQDAAPAAPSPIEEKLDRLIALMEARDSVPEEPSGEKALDALLEQLEDNGSSSDEKGKEDTPLTGEARDAALAILKSVRPAVAAIADRGERTRVADALLEAVKGGGTLAAITKAAQQNARTAADAARKTNYEQICAEQKAAYDARNPHKKQEG